MKLKGTERVMVCPLGWGLGHASRMVPVINYLASLGCYVIVAADNSSISFIKARIKGVEFIHFPSYKVRFSSSKNQLFTLAGIAKKVIFRSVSEHFEIDKLIKANRVDVLISDNRYGLYSKSIPSILVTHQLSIRFPKPFTWLKGVGEWYVNKHVRNFTECWIPDSPTGFSVSGELSQPLEFPRNVTRIGLLSRFNGQIFNKSDSSYELVALISGPSPQRELFEQEVIVLAQRLKIKTLILQGQVNGNEKVVQSENIFIIPNPNDTQIAQALLSANHIICRSGYSTLMDLLALGVNAILIPTPGQTEQEYLAKHMASTGFFSTCDQSRIKSLEIKEQGENLKRTISSFEFFPLV